MASVMTNGASFNRVMSTPFTQPHSRPTTTVAGTTTMVGRPRFSIIRPLITVHNAPTAPTDRFMPPMTATMSCAAAIKP